MKLNKLLTQFLGASFATAIMLSGAAFANDEFLAQCAAYGAEHNADINCSCLDDAAKSDPSLYEEYAKVSEPEDAANLSEAAQAVVASCSAN